MKPVHILILVVALFSACKSDNNSSGLPITKDSLMGNWVVIRVKTISSSKEYEASMQSTITSIKDKAELSIFNFQPAGVLTIDQGRIATSSGHWIFNASQQLLMQPKNKDLNFTSTSSRPPIYTVTRYKNDSLILVKTVGNNGKDSLQIRHIFKRLKHTKTAPDLFDPALNKWREKPRQEEDDNALKIRIKQLLYYYAAYFSNISESKIPYFNIQKIHCPIIFYSGGIGLKKFNASDEWTNVFYDGLDAKQAHTLLSDAFSKISGYPDRGEDYVQEYVAALKMVADAL